MHPAGIEPTSTVPKTGTLSVELRVHIENVRVAVIETASHPWQGRVLPLNHTRATYSIENRKHYIFKRLILQRYFCVETKGYFAHLEL